MFDTFAGMTREEWLVYLANWWRCDEAEVERRLASLAEALGD